MSTTGNSAERYASSEDTFQIKRYGDIAIIIPSSSIESLPSNLIEPAAQMVLAPLKENPPTHLIVDLSNVSYFGSEFITFLLRCHLLVKKRDSELVLAGLGDRIRELLHQTALDTLWAIYDDRATAIAALSGD
ncbi:STAS domain-containing protein [Telmatocola sphagniphila]|uniref:STAS domain-containing protein n=1 Tax=Telmatocola sphagniphila TaxID=1123043 RepID=A0A8E6B7S1_9BACT|nr:STAS domain-containing protein [Telmatocola sphagniphila]QVL33316.1 STAS domain-containing protein [Telmatocola sphagniphila]